MFWSDDEAKPVSAALSESSGTAIADTSGELLMCVIPIRNLSPATEILAYLSRQEQDTIHGIQWAVLRMSIPNFATKIAETVEELVECGYLERSSESSKRSSSKTRESKMLYCLSPRYLSTLRKRRSATSTTNDTGNKIN